MKISPYFSLWLADKEKKKQKKKLPTFFLFFILF